MTYRVIAFDGGGIRGLISALLLQNLDPDGRLVASADLFAGTSTGSFLALALAHGVRLRDIIELYQERGGYIFHEAPVDWSCVNPFSFDQQAAYDTAVRDGLAADGETIKAIFQAKYLSDHLRNELGTIFGTATLADLGKTRRQAVVNSLQLWSQAAGEWTPAALGSGAGDPFAAMSLVDAAMCSGAAPTYFPPHQPAGANGAHWGYFADGGLFANNPAAAAVAYAVEHFGQNLADIRVLSFGTGHTAQGIPGAALGQPKCWGAWQWLRPAAQDGGTVPAAPLIEAALSASAAACGQYARQMLGDRYVRIDLALNAPYALDNWQDVQVLETAVKEFVAGPEWGPMVKAVYQRWEGDPAPDNPPPPAPPHGGGEDNLDQSVTRLAPTAARGARAWLSRFIGA